MQIQAVLRDRTDLSDNQLSVRMLRETLQVCLNRVRSQPIVCIEKHAFEKCVVLRGQLQPEYYVAIVCVYNQAAL